MANQADIVAAQLADAVAKPSAVFAKVAERWQDYRDRDAKLAHEDVSEPHFVALEALSESAPTAI